MTENNTSVSQFFIFRYPLDNILGAVVFPVERINIPLYGVVSVFIGTGDDLVIIVAVRRPEKEHIVAGELFYLVVDANKFLDMLGFFQLDHIGMTLAVIAQGMA